MQAASEMVRRRPTQSETRPAVREPASAQTLRMPASTCSCVSLVLRSSLMNSIAPLITPLSASTITTPHIH